MPTASTALSLLPRYEASFNNLLQTATSVTQFQQGLIAVENQLPANLAWLATHLILAGLSLLLVVLAAYTFQRFRRAVSAS